MQKGLKLFIHMENCYPVLYGAMSVCLSVLN